MNEIYKSFSDALFNALLWFDELTRTENCSNERIELYQKKKKIIIIKDFFDLLDEDMCTMDIVSAIPPRYIPKITEIAIVCDQEATIKVRKDKPKVHVWSTKTAYFKVGNLKMLNGKPRPNSGKVTLTDCKAVEE